MAGVISNDSQMDRKNRANERGITESVPISEHFSYVITKDLIGKIIHAMEVRNYDSVIDWSCTYIQIA